MKKIDLSIVIPVRNEALNVYETARRIDASMKMAGINYETIFVVDKSEDETQAKVDRLALEYESVKSHQKKGRPGKAFSILEGVEQSLSEWIVMIDGDLQYPPEKIAEMFQIREQYGLVVANRKTHKSNIFRRIFSKINRIISNELLLGLNGLDTQSGLKLFRKELIANLDLSKVGQWTLDAPLIYTAMDLGYEVGSVDITFEPRAAGKAQINIIVAAPNIVLGAIKLRFRKLKIYSIPPTGEKMIGAGVVYKRKRFITHSTLLPSQSAMETISKAQLFVLFVLVGIIGCSLFLNWRLTLTALIGLLSFVYFVDVIFTLILVLKSLQNPPELVFSKEEIDRLDESSLPVYSILCPLYKEAAVLPEFLQNIEKFDYPKNKLDVILLLEENDERTIQAANELSKPDYLRVVVVPHSQPKTKPKACNYGISVAKGEFVVIYDAEDKPEPEQLKKAVLGFSRLPSTVYCLQAKLNYYNPNHNLLTRLFTAEYSLWFDLVLPALQSIETAIPLGGTSNHFRRESLLELRGWDAFNVTEDCDLGVRLFASGKKTALIDSITLEEANSDMANWIRQRSRWIKGYFQTYLVQMRDPVKFVRAFGVHALIFQLVIGARTTFMLINPLLWLMTIAYFTLYSIFGPTIESFYPAPIFYMAVFSLLLGNFVYFYNYMIGCAKRGHYTIIKFVFLVPFYWLMVSLAAVKAFSQLIFKPYYWEKTNHGLHLPVEKKVSTHSSWLPDGLVSIISDRNIISGSILVLASVLGNFLGFAYNFYLGGTVAPSLFELMVLLGGFIYVIQIITGPVHATVTHQSALLMGKFGFLPKSFWRKTRERMWIVSTILAFIWVAITPFLMSFFHSNDIWGFLLFTPVWVLGTITAVDRGFLNGSLYFKHLALLILVEAVSKLALTVLLVQTGQTNFVFAAIPLSMSIAFMAGWIFVLRISENSSETSQQIQIPNIDVKFFASSILNNLSVVIFLALDLILVQHFISGASATAFSYLALVGKMVFLFSSLLSQFINPVVSYLQGLGRGAEETFNRLLMLTCVSSFVGFFFFGVVGEITVPLLWGGKVLEAVPYLPAYALAMAFFAISSSIISYHLVRGHYLFVALNLTAAAFEIVGIVLFHKNLSEVVSVILASASGLTAITLALHVSYDLVSSLASNLVDFFGLFQKIPHAKQDSEQKERILFFNWRDRRHVWAGGAEAYAHEIAKRLVSMGHAVTMFCGNDGKSARYETIDGVEIIRRGGFYFVYLWAMLYYVFKLRGRFDVVIDCENGVPFFTPLYVQVKKYLLIHAVNQQIFRKSLPLPMYLFASFLEKNVMPLFYRNIPVITVSPSSKSEIMRHNLTNVEPVVIYNGISLDKFKPGQKSEKPLITYIGRIKDHKSLPVFVQAADLVLKSLPEAEFVIAGDGPDKQEVVKLVEKLGLGEKIRFLGYVSEETKIDLYQRSWVFVNPSLMEGWGVTSIEANACGTPVVASNVPGLRDSVHNPHSGFLVPYGHAESFAEKIEVLIKNKKIRTQMAAAAVRWAKNFDWDKSAAQMAQFISKK